MEPNTLPGNATGSTEESNRPLRVVQWATGNIGSRAMRAVIEHPGLALAGVFVTNPDKQGRDAAELCGLDEPTGVQATGDIEEILALDADCVLYMPLLCDVEQVIRILAAGSNIVTTCGEFLYPAGMDPELRARVEEACRTGGTSIHSTGVSPGFISEAVPLVLTSIQRRLTSLSIEEYADVSSRNSPEMLFDIMGFGKPPAGFEQWRLDHVRNNFGPSLQLLADSIGLPLDSIEASGELAAARNTFEIAAGTIEAGTLAAQRITVTGMRNGKPLMSFRATWYCGTDTDADWKIGATGWHISVDGDSPLEVDLAFAVPLERMAEFTPSFTANPAVNAIQPVCAAPPGIRAGTDLPQIIATLG